MHAGWLQMSTDVYGCLQCLQYTFHMPVVISISCMQADDVYRCLQCLQCTGHIPVFISISCMKPDYRCLQMSTVVYSVYMSTVHCPYLSSHLYRMHAGWLQMSTDVYGCLQCLQCLQCTVHISVVMSIACMQADYRCLQMSTVVYVIYSVYSALAISQ